MGGQWGMMVRWMGFLRAWGWGPVTFVGFSSRTGFSRLSGLPGGGGGLEGWSSGGGGFSGVVPAQGILSAAETWTTVQVRAGPVAYHTRTQGLACCA